MESYTLMTLTDCIFCDIINKKLPCHLIYNDNNQIAILDKYPIDIGHTLIITKKPHEKLTDMSIDEITELFSRIPKIVNAIIKATKADAFSIAQNNGKAAKQIVPHVHVHIIPRYNATGTLWTQRKIMKDSELNELAQKIRNFIE
ncbi:HIT domain signature protein [Marine Group I thaumarchaeote SCGC AAA799-O18]|nr:HIT domain signature protein [Marine Group I thaumarchaeote SCGC AAA799-O18]